MTSASDDAPDEPPPVARAVPADRVPALDSRARARRTGAAELDPRLRSESPGGADSPFHSGERAVQARTGRSAQAKLLGNMFRASMPDPHRAFYAELPFALVGSVDAEGQPWASMLVGAPGFLSSPDPQTLRVDAAPLAGDPLAQNLRAGAALGLLGIQLESRRRNRVNGHVRELWPGGFALAVDQSFGNCPKYINLRSAEPAPDRPPPSAAEPLGPDLSDPAIACIRASDTCFIASASSGTLAAADRREGVDVSHRGGKPGFVRVDRAGAGLVLRIPDFAGNNAFNTLGNLARHPRAGLLFPDFDRGDLWILACEANIVWDGATLGSFAGAERLIELRVRSGRLLAGALPFRWSPPQLGLQLERTGRW